MRSAFYAGYEESDREYVLLGAAGRRLAEGKTLVSTTFVVPYPPGFPVLVPGQVISKEILYFLATRREGNPRVQPRPRAIGLHRSGDRTHNSGPLMPPTACPVPRRRRRT